MTIEQFTETIKNNAYDIAVEIKVAEELLKGKESEIGKDCVRAAAYEQILKVIREATE